MEQDSKVGSDINTLLRKRDRRVGLFICIIDFIFMRIHSRGSRIY